MICLFISSKRGEFLKVRFDGPPKPTPESRALPGIVERYFALDHPLAEICVSFPNDPVMNAARDFCRGLRIIRQPKWECLATFICSSMKQVAHIRQISQELRERFGEQRRVGNHLLSLSFASPTCTSLERSCAIARSAFARKICAGRRGSSAPANRTSSLGRPDDNEVRAELCPLPGVGRRLQMCLALCGSAAARFPVDVWIERVCASIIFASEERDRGRLREFSETYFGDHGGYTQQYFFHMRGVADAGDRAIEVNRPYLGRNR